MDELARLARLPQRYEQCLRARPGVISLVRHIVCAQVRLWGRESVADAAGLCVTELLANVAKHVASDRCVVMAESRRDGVRLSVADGAARLPVVREPDWCAESGRGMFLIAGTASRWGARRTVFGKEVWVELHEPAPRAGEAPPVNWTGAKGSTA